ncbi:hypothetical protein [Macaca mulatta feces associated virus 3]|uniref:Uncharacterized protein n=1 Tax=Macaca mulatta feces associated virus 3 TaxID=2499225 RepID=A0A1W5PX85_9VIRU|nr:hypothetical protein QKB80_gp2 [Macaca mulatta feces associated virus 3]APG55843.1 hypothetical protein [Macaca mulatta feces associated virus 3]
MTSPQKLEKWAWLVSILQKEGWFTNTGKDSTKIIVVFVSLLAMLLWLVPRCCLPILSRSVLKLVRSRPRTCLIRSCTKPVPTTRCLRSSTESMLDLPQQMWMSPRTRSLLLMKLLLGTLVWLSVNTVLSL